MKAKKLEFDEIKKDQILVGDEIAQEMIKSVTKLEVTAFITFGLTIAILYFGNFNLITGIIIGVIGFGFAGGLYNMKEEAESKVEHYFLTKKAANPNFVYGVPGEETEKNK